MEPQPRNCNENCPGNIEHRTPVSIISRVNYRLAHNVLSLSADDEWLIKDAVSCVMDLVAEVEDLKERVEKWKAWHESASEYAKKWRQDAQAFYGALQKIAEYHGTKDEVWANNMRSIAKKALADRP